MECAPGEAHRDVEARRARPGTAQHRDANERAGGPGRNASPSAREPASRASTIAPGGGDGEAGVGRGRDRGRPSGAAAGSPRPRRVLARRRADRPRHRAEQRQRRRRSRPRRRPARKSDAAEAEVDGARAQRIGAGPRSAQNPPPPAVPLGLGDRRVERVGEPGEIVLGDNVSGGKRLDHGDAVSGDLDSGSGGRGTAAPTTNCAKRPRWSRSTSR